MTRLDLFSLFHLNLMFSSIEEEARPEVIRRCYWPLLRLADEDAIPVGIELTGYTLEAIHTLDPSWVTELCRLIDAGRMELVGSGYSQIIGPLVPAAVNRANQREGLRCYTQILGVHPRLALVNEQAWSAGLIDIYREAGYEAVIMEWENPALDHPEWSNTYRYYPQRALGTGGESLPLLWNQSITFQKFQRYAHGEIQLDHLLSWLVAQIGDRPRVMALYGNDVEIFDFRPGRFHTEAELADESEWDRIRRLFKSLQQDERFRLILPSAALNHQADIDANHPLRLESAAQPIPVKKQAKYNIIRWAVSGRDDLDINSRCHRLLNTLGDTATSADWKKLCFLWSSDFRTHITEKRWLELQRKMTAFENRQGIKKDDQLLTISQNRTSSVPGPFQLVEEKTFVKVNSSTLMASFNLRRGLALESLFLLGEERMLTGTLQHGFYNNIRFGNDYYTGHLAMEVPSQHKVTDLNPVVPDIYQDISGRLCIQSSQQLEAGPLTKIWRISPDQPEIELLYHIDWRTSPRGMLRLGHITLHPAAFDINSLTFRTNNGGNSAENFAINKQTIDHLQPISSLISANQGLGMTEGWMDIGDRHHRIRVEFDPTLACVTGHIHFVQIPPLYFCRITFSLQEMDDTFNNQNGRHSLIDRTVLFRLRFESLSQS